MGLNLGEKNYAVSAQMETGNILNANSALSILVG